MECNPGTVINLSSLYTEFQRMRDKLSPLSLFKFIVQSIYTLRFKAVR